MSSQASGILGSMFALFLGAGLVPVVNVILWAVQALCRVKAEVKASFIFRWCLCSVKKKKGTIIMGDVTETNSFIKAQMICVWRCHHRYGNRNNQDNANKASLATRM